MRHDADDNYWTPKLGETVYYNYPDSPDPIGTVVGFVSDEAEHRAGQPIIRGATQRTPFEDSEPGYVVVHPMFLLPFPFNGEEWQQAQREGRIK